MPDETRDPSTATAGRTPGSNPTAGAADPGGTGGRTPDSPAALVAVPVPTIPGYEVLEEIGSGGMGVVYRARQVPLGRDVALKTLLRPDLPHAAVARFWAEAEVMAAVRHPNVVQVFELGEHDGRPFLAMELVTGGSLRGRLLGGPIPPRETAELVERIAHGVAAAHELGVVHRDLKPANVLLAADGSPKVADFGVAKWRSAELTATQAWMGTPAYMAPEQAAGRAKFVGPQADVWALGVILYECVAGRRPFDGDSAEEMLAQIRTVQPVPLRSHARRVSRDLETVCLKCLEKDPANRYADGRALGEELRRWLDNLPIAARRPGPVGRLVRWTRRNPVVAGATAAVALALLAGTGVSLAYGLEADRQKKEAEAAAGQATAARDDLARKNDELNGAAVELARVNDELNGELARALLGPLNPDRSTGLSEYETRAFWEVAARRDSVGYRLLEEATRTPLAAKQFASRAEFAFHAAVGLSPEARVRAEQLLLSRLADPSARREHRTDLALAAARCGPLSVPLASAGARTLTDALAAAKTADQRVELAEGVAAVAGSLPLDAAASACRRAAATLADALAHKTPTSVPDAAPLAGALKAVAAGLPPGEGAKTLTAALEKTTDPVAWRILAEGVATVAGGLPPDEGAAACRPAAAVLSAALTKTTIQYEMIELAEGLVALAAHLHTSEAADLLIAAVEKARDEPNPAGVELSKHPVQHYLSVLANGLASVSVDLPPERVADLCRRAARALSAATTRDTTRMGMWRELAAALATVTARLSPNEAAELCRPAAAFFTRLLAKTPPEYLLGEWAEGLAAVAARLPPDEAARLGRPAAKLLLESFDKPPSPGNSDGRRTAAVGLVAVAARLPAGEAAGLLTSAAGKTTEPRALRALAEGAAALAARLSPDEGVRVCRPIAARLTEVLPRLTGQYDLGVLAEGLSVVAGRLPPDEAGEVCRPVVRTLAALLARSTPDEYTHPAVAQGLTAVAKRLPPPEAAQILTAAVAGTTDAAALGGLAEGLAALDPPADPRPLAGAFLDAVGVSGPFARRSPADGWRLVLLGTPPRNRVRPETLWPLGMFATPHQLLPSVPSLHPHVRPPGRPLPPQALVELLKHPFCVGEVRLVVLDALAFTYRRPFADLWGFVEFARAHQPQLDLLTPPKRPLRHTP